MKTSTSDRRSFFLRMGTALAAWTGLVTQSKAAVNELPGQDAWFEKIKGSHKIVFDAPSPHSGFQVVWTWVFLDSHNQTGVPDGDMTAVVVLRHTAIGLALEDRLWKKYKLGKQLDITDPHSGAPADRNPYWQPAAGEMPEPGMSIRDLQQRGVLFCVCERAIANQGAMIAKSKGLDATEVKKDLLAGLLPGIHPVVSGVWAIEKTQQLGCAYCFAG